MIETTKVIAYGNDRLVVQGLNSDNTNYLANAVRVKGLVNFSMDFTQETTPYPADDDVEYIAIRGAPQGSGTTTLRGIESTDYAIMYPVISNTSEGVHFGEDLPIKYFGISFDEKTVSNGIDSINRYVIYKCRADNLPSVSTETMSGTSVTPRDISISLAASPVYFMDGNIRKRRIFSVFNSIKDEAEFKKYENGLIFPSVS